MKILIINKFLYPNGGSETYIFELGRKLRELGHEVQFFGMEHEGRIVGNHAESYTSSMDFHGGSKLAKLTYPLKTLYSKEARVKLRAVLDDFEPDVVHLNNFNYQLTPSVIYEVRAWEKKKGKKIKLLYTAHDLQLVCPNHAMQIPSTKANCEACLSGKYGKCIRQKCIHDSAMKSVLGALESRIYRSLKTYRMIDRIICPSYFMEEKLEHNPDLKGRCVMLRNFVKGPGEYSGNPFPEGVLPEGEFVLYFGRFSEEKGIDTLLSACKDLPEIRFVFAGKGPLEDKVNALSNVVNVGFCNDTQIHYLLDHAAFSILPSECYENCPFSVLESQMCGTPVLGADRGGIPELIEEGSTGELFPAGDPEALSGQIKAMWENKERIEAYRQNCRELHFVSLEEYCESYLELCQ